MAQSNKFSVRDADFRLFLVLWNQRMNMTTPGIHARMAAWLEHCWNGKKKKMLLMAFRASGKSTLSGLFAAWLLYRNPDLRILVLAADYTLATKMVQTVRRIIERHPLTQHMKPARADQWAGDRFTVKRFTVQRDPSMIARGVTSNITGSRADIVICDDVEVPNTCDTAEKRDELRARLAEIDYVLAPGGTQFYIGTPHSYYTIYADKPRAEMGEEREFLRGFTRFEIPILDADGECVWPEKYGSHDIEQMKIHTGPNKFASQMMLRPVNIAQGRLNPELLQAYRHDLDYTKTLDALFIGETKMVSASAFWDPAFGSNTGDRSVLAVVFTDAEGNYYLHHVEYIKVSATDKTDDATQQCKIVAAIAKAMMLPSVAVETNGIGGFLPAILRNELVRAGALCGVKKIHSTRTKDMRITEAFDAPMAARRLFVHKSVFKTPFLMEMQEWRPYAKNGHDDGLDAVAGALALQPVRITRLYGSGAHSWMGGARGQKAKTEFEV